MEKLKRQYSITFKEKAVELGLHRGNLSSVARELDIRPDMLSRWIREFKSGKYENKHKNPKEKTKEELELIHLRRELLDVKMERDILKKAVSIFSKSDR